jgi:hypothetical protein
MKSAVVLVLILAADRLAFPRRARAEDDKYQRYFEPALEAFLRQQQIPGLRHRHRGKQSGGLRAKASGA